MIRARGGRKHYQCELETFKDVPHLYLTRFAIFFPHVIHVIKIRQNGKFFFVSSVLYSLRNSFISLG